MYGKEEMTVSAARCVGLCMCICMGVSVFNTKFVSTLWDP